MLPIMSSNHCTLGKKYGLKGKGGIAGTGWPRDKWRGHPDDIGNKTAGMKAAYRSNRHDPSPYMASTVSP